MWKRRHCPRKFWAAAFIFAAAARGAWPAEAAPPVTQEDLKLIRQQLNALASEVRSLRKENAALKQEIETLKKSRPAAPAATAAPMETDLEALRQAAREALAAETPAKEEKETIFKAKGLGLQALNPEISFAGDMNFTAHDDHGKDDRTQTDFNFRVLDMHVQSYVDPYTRFKAAIEFHEGEDVELGEAYVTRFGVLPDTNLTVGKFRQQFGVVNRWHKHALDQFDFPLALREIFGEGGLNQTGLSVDWNMPTWGKHQQVLTVQITDGQNHRLFDENALNLPSVLVHYKNYWDLNKDTYAQVGATALVGQNDEWRVSRNGQTTTVHNRRLTAVLGADFSLLWEPTQKMEYRNVEFRTEAYLMNRQIMAPDDSGPDSITAWGGYSYLQTRLSRTWYVGVRGDFYQPATKKYADTPGLSLYPHAVAADNAYRWAVCPYVTWQTTHFMKWRLEYNHEDGKGMESPDDRLILQCVFAVGPHKHDRY